MNIDEKVTRKSYLEYKLSIDTFFDVVFSTTKSVTKTETYNVIWSKAGR